MCVCVCVHIDVRVIVIHPVYAAVCRLRRTALWQPSLSSHSLSPPERKRRARTRGRKRRVERGEIRGGGIGGREE